MKTLSLFAAMVCLTSCAGYQLGATKPAALAHVKTIAVPMFSNGTLHPRAEALATSAVASALVVDGTYRLADTDHADAVLIGKMAHIEYDTIRGSRYDVLRPEELTNEVTLEWKLLDARDRTKVLAAGSSTGSSQLYVADNLQTARNNALPDALERAATALVVRLANGY